LAFGYGILIFVLKDVFYFKNAIKTIDTKKQT